MKKMLKRVLAAFLAAVVLSGFAYAETAEAVTDAPENEEIVVEQPVPMQSVVRLQNGMRAVMLTPSVDFCKEEMSDLELAEELSSLFTEIKSYGLNAVLINAQSEDSLYYSLEVNGSNGGVLGAAIDAAHNAGLYAYAVLDVSDLVSEVIANGGGLKNGFSAAAHKFAMKYACEGIILKNYYTYDTALMHAEYMASGSGIGYTNWLYETNEYICRTLSEVIRRTNNSVAVGMLISDMWANYTSHEHGSITADTVEALYDGFCDTKKYFEQGYADFALVQAYGTTSDNALNFECVLSWWYELTQECGAKLYMLHMNERIGQYNGWYEDQLLRQLTVMEDYSDVGGSAFNSLSSLRANPLGTTDTLMKYFEDRINTDTIFEDLEMISPTSLSFVTYDSTVKFMGTFDENFDVYFDGKRIELNEVGNFYFLKELDVGWNSYSIEHKGHEYKYSIERRIDVMQSIEQESDVTVEGGASLSLVAIAYSGSTVTATIGGKTVQLQEKENSSEELDANGSYAKFVGYYTVPDGIVGQEQYLGNISFYASYSMYDEYITGGAVTVAAKPEPPKQNVNISLITNQSALGTGEVVGTMDPIVTDSEYIQYVRVVNNYTNVYDGMTTGAIPSPLFSQLPAGTIDYVRSSSDGYITTTSGKRFDQNDVTTFTDTGLGYNGLVVKAVGNTGGYSFIKLHLDYKSSYNITTPVALHNDMDGAFGVENYNADKVYITFDNITSVTKLPSFEYCSLFSGGEWETVEEDGIPKFRLALTLRQSGIYSGCGAYYDENGDLMLTFAVPTATLSGKVIVIDPGHGYGVTADRLSPGAIGNVTEQSVNVAVAKELDAVLTAMGATVVRLRTESEFLPTNDRPNVARQYGADMFISLHCNSSTNTSAHGVEVYYFTHFSQPLARAINNNLAAYYDNSVYGDGTQSSRGDKYSYYWVTLQQDFPSVLVEMGFISNERECMVMADPTYQAGMAQSIANGVYDYFARSSITYSGNGSADVPVTETPVPEEPSVPVEPDVPEEPSVPVEPDEPDEPSVPVEPEEPEEPSISVDPDLPEEPPYDPDLPEEPPVEIPEEPTGGGIRVE